MNKPHEYHHQGLNVSEAQSKSYINWINSHLKKRPGVKLVENLQIDVCNGVVFIHLIEVLSGHVFTDVNLNPRSVNDCKENIEKILKFMQMNSIKMNKTPAKALAAHFKPSNLVSATSGQSLRQSTTTSSLSTANSASNKHPLGSNRNFAQSTNNLNLNSNNQIANNNENHAKPVLNQTRTLDSMTQLVQSACVSFADVRRYKNENFNVKYVKYVNLQPNPGMAQASQNSNESKQASSNYVNTASPTSHINNKTYVTNNAHAIQSPIAKTPNDEYSFSNMTIMSPSKPLPLASSTLIQPYIPNEFNKDEEKVEVNFKKNQTHLIDEAKTNNNNVFKIPVIPPELKPDESPQNQRENKETSDSYNERANKEETIHNLPDAANKQDEKQTAEIRRPTQEIINPLLEDEFLNDVQDVKHILLALQSMLMRGNVNELMLDLNNGELKQKLNEINMNENNEMMENGDVSNTSASSGGSSSSGDECPLSSLTLEEQIAIYRSKIQQLEILSSDLRNELNQFKSEQMHKVGVQSGLRSRVTEQDKTILEMKSEHLNLHLSNQHLMKEIDEFKSQYEECLAQTKSLRKELTSRDEQIERMKNNINELIKEKEESKILLHKLKGYADSLEAVNDKENIICGLIGEDKKGIENSRPLLNSKKDTTFVINKAQLGIRPSNLTMTCDESAAIKETLSQLRNLIVPNHPSLNLIDDLDHYFKSIIERSNSHVATSGQSIGQIPVNTILPSSSSNSSSLTSSSANSPVHITNNEHSPTSVKSSSSSSTTNLIPNPSRVLHNSANFERPLLNTNVNFKRSTESIFSQAPSFKTIQSNFSSNLTRTPNVKSQESTSRGEPVSKPIINNVKKIVSRFDAQSQSSANSFKPPAKKVGDDEKFLNPSSILKLSKCLQTPSQTPSSSSLLTISSSTSSSTTVSSNHSPSSSMPHSSTSSSSSLSSNVGAYNSTKCVYYIEKDTSPYMITIYKNLHNVTLMDFKERLKLNPASNFRFFFKSPEPEFGFLKEEISNDQSLLPCFENRIVAWIEESS